MVGVGIYPIFFNIIVLLDSSSYVTVLVWFSVLASVSTV